MSTRRAKGEGIIEQPQGVIRTTQEKVIVNTLIQNKPRKKVLIITTYETINTIIIYIGNRDIYCMDVKFFKDNKLNTADTGYLTKERWDTICSVGEPFGKGDDTIILIKLLLTYIKDKYPNVLRILFTDMSTKIYDDDSSVNLAAMKLLTDGKTWYESHFDVIMEKMYEEVYNNMKKIAIEKKAVMPFEDFIGYLNITMIPLSIDEMKKQYNNSNTYQEFFVYIHNRIGISKYCIWLSSDDWFDNFTRIVLNINTLSIELIFEPKQYDISYKIMNIMGGN